MNNEYKVFAAWVSDADKFLVIASSIETATAQAENITAMMYLSHGIVLDVRKIEEYKI